MRKRVLWIGLIAVLFLAISATQAFALSGAIFTTLEDGSVVNANVQYNSKSEVYLDGGPGPGAPQTAAGLPDGHYYFQVTNPSGSKLLSMDPIESREIIVEGGIITGIVPAPTQTYFEKKWWGTHAHGHDIDHGALTVQLMPYADTDNRGGVYKVWITNVNDYAAGQGKWGFIPSKSKTDNFKVKKPQFIPPKIVVRKFWDKNCNGIWDGRGLPGGEPELIDEWSVTWVDPIGCESGPKTMPYTVYPAMPEGTWTFTEEMQDGWFQTAAIVDGGSQALNLSASVVVAGSDKECHEVIFGNAPKGCLKAYKFLDKNLDGECAGDDPVEGVTFNLTGTDMFGKPVSDSKETGKDGYAVFCDLLPGDYTITEVVPEGSFPTTDISWSTSLKSGECLWQKFGNARFGCVFADKFYDLDADGVKDEGEDPVAGIWFKLTGTTYKGETVDPICAKSGADGMVEWCDLYPGTYTITEVLPPGHWEVTTDNPQTVTLGEGAEVGGAFGNICWKCADFNTKGFWHNKNGLAILADHPEWIDYVNTLAPYAGNPFDGYDQYGNPVPAAKGEWGEDIAPAGSDLAEISHFLVDNNSEYKQLEQQLLAFIFNAKCTGAGAVKWGDGWKSVDWIIEQAIEAWDSGCDVVRWAGILDCYNNSDFLQVVCSAPCAVPSYPCCEVP